MRKKFVIIILLMSLNCVTRFVKIHDAPQSPTFVVVPTSFQTADLTFSNEVTEAFIANGARIVERPVMLKTFLVEESERTGLLTLGSGIMAGAGSGKSIGQSFIDPVSIFDSTSADYIVLTQAQGKWIKIVKRDNREVVFLGKPTFDEPLKNFVKKLILTIKSSRQ